MAIEGHCQVRTACLASQQLCLVLCSSCTIAASTSSDYPASTSGTMYDGKTSVSLGDAEHAELVPSSSTHIGCATAAAAFNRRSLRMRL
jgi:hypothetical protein